MAAFTVIGPDPATILRRAVSPIITIAPGETWCTGCGETSHNGTCARCGGHSTVAVTEVLHPGEYTVAG